MQPQMIPIGDLKIAAANMRNGRKKPDVSDLVPSVKAHGVLQSLLVRPNCEGFEVLAGRRRFYAAEEAGLTELPCLVGEFEDDADAIEASMIENSQRLDPDPLTQFETFDRMVKAGRTVEDIAETFCVPVHKVNQRLAIAGLVPGIRKLIRDDEFSDHDIRLLTTASTERQREYLALRKEDKHPRYGLRAFLFPKGQIETAAAIFDRADYTGTITADLFRECEYFMDVDQFWSLQTAAIEVEAAKLTAGGWTDVHILERGAYFEQWKYDPVSKADGGHVYIVVTDDGHVEIKKGLLTTAQARRVAQGQEAGADPSAAQEKPLRAEIPEALQNYFHLHRAAAVKDAVADDPKTALRFAVAVLLVGGENVRLEPEATRPRTPEIEASTAASPAATRFKAKRSKVWTMLGLKPDTYYRRDADLLAKVFAKLLGMANAKVMQILAVAIADQIEVGSPLVDVLGETLSVDMTGDWSADDVFFDMLRDKGAIGAVLAEVAGQDVRSANAKATGKVQKGIVRDCLTGSNGRDQVTGWIPAYLKFPATPYTGPHGQGWLSRNKAARKAFAQART